MKYQGICPTVLSKMSKNENVKLEHPEKPECCYGNFGEIWKVEVNVTPIFEAPIRPIIPFLESKGTKFNSKFTPNIIISQISLYPYN